MLYSGEQILSFKPCLLFYALKELIFDFYLQYCMQFFFITCTIRELCHVHAKCLQYTCISIWCMRYVLFIGGFMREWWRIESCKIAWNNILQTAEENIWKQCTTLLALMQLLAVPYNRCEQQKWVYFH